VNTTPRILIVDDNPAIHQDFRKILDSDSAATSQLDDLAASLFGSDETKTSRRKSFRIEYAFQGLEAIEKIQKALEASDPFWLVFMDVRMPPGLDGIETLERIQAITPELQSVLCTAYSDHSWETIASRVGENDSLVILKKPFESIEVLQLAHALTQKWDMSRQARLKMEFLDEMVRERTAALVLANERLREEISERARVQEALRHSEERFSTAFKASPMAMAILSSPELRFMDANDRFLQLSGRNSGELLSNTVSQLGVWSETICQRLLAVNRGEHMKGQCCKFEGGKNASRDTLLWAESINLNCGPCFLIIAEDVTDQKKLETQLRQAQKMEAVGRLASGIAHEFNNLLTVIRGHGELLKVGGASPKFVCGSATRIVEASNRASGLTRQLLSFSRKQTLNLKPIDLGQAVEATRSMLSLLLGERHELKVNCAPGLPPTLADVGCLEQVLINLIINARDAMPEGGVISISTGAIEVEANQSLPTPDAAPGKYVFFQVQDTGCGMTRETIQRAFDPFFSTKELGKGTGLGLSVIDGIVRQHKGWINITSEVNAGSTFTINLPVCANGEVTELPQPVLTPSSVRMGKSETVLVVEDDLMVRDVARATLEAGGYKVIEANDAEKAMEMVRNSMEPISVLITDIGLPNGLSGLGLASRINEQHPNVRTIYISGYGMDAFKEELPDDFRRTHQFLPKPFEPLSLLQAVADSLDAKLSRLN
jgi:signal transduction histidine kinase/DNA-binding response OmpR family regulator